MERDCLWMKAKNANADGSNTHIHWGFAEIDTAHWTPVIKDPKGQWADFKALTGVKRIVSFGGWAYSTEPATYNILRQAIIENRETFAIALASFVKTEGLDGVDIDWEYPGVSTHCRTSPLNMLPLTSTKTGSRHSGRRQSDRAERRRGRLP
jgi:GH18 family chitinase